MADPLTINVTQAATSVPVTYTVPASVEVEPLAAFAHFNGAAAASAFLPALTFYSASGLILARVFPSEQIAAGGSADVSYFPGVGGSGISLPLPPTSLSVLGCRIAYFTGAVPSGISIPNATFTPLTYNTNKFDTGNFHPITTDTNLTGTVSKTAGVTTITGTGTSFTTELSVGDPVRIPGGVIIFYPDVVTVASITDNTHFESYIAPAQTAAGQTAVLDSSCIVAQYTGYYHFWSHIYYRSSAVGARELNIVLDGIDGGENALLGSNTHVLASVFAQPITAVFETAFTIESGTLYLQQGEFVQMFAYQDSGAALEAAADLTGLNASCVYLGV